MVTGAPAPRSPTDQHRDSVRDEFYQTQRDRKYDPAKDSVKKELEDQLNGERKDYIARPFDTIEVKDTKGVTVDIWQVISSSGVSGGDVRVRSTKTGTVITIPSKMFELKKYKAPTEDGREVILKPVESGLFRFNKEDDGTYTVSRVPILETSARNQEVFDEQFLDRLVATFWGDKIGIMARYGSDVGSIHSYEPTVIVGHHPDKAERHKFENDQKPCLGTVSALWREGSVLYSNWSYITKENAIKLANGSWPNRSAEVKVTAGRLTSVAVLTEEPYFHLPQMKRIDTSNFSENSTKQNELVLQFSFEKGITNMDPASTGNNPGAAGPPAPSSPLTELLSHLQAATAVVEKAIGDPAEQPPQESPVEEPQQPQQTGEEENMPNPNPNKDEYPAERKSEGTNPRRFEEGNSGSYKSQNDSGTSEPLVGDQPESQPLNSGNRPTTSSSNQTAPEGTDPSDKEIKLSELKEENRRLRETNLMLSEKLSAAVTSLQQNNKETRRLSFQRELERLASSGVQVGGDAGIKRHVDTMLRLNADDANAYLENIRTTFPRQKLHGGVAASLGATKFSTTEGDTAKFSAEYDKNERSFSRGGLSREAYIASCLLGELTEPVTSFNNDEDDTFDFGKEL